MLRKLRRQFMLIVMVLLSTVLVGVLGSTLIASWQVQGDLLDERLSRALDSYERSLYSFDDEFRHPQLDEGRRVDEPTLVIEIANDGIVLNTNESWELSGEELSTAIKTARSSIDTKGRRWDIHVAWSRLDIGSDHYILAIADTTDTDAAFVAQIVRYLQITAVALIALFAISWWLSGWALKPVEKAWDQQQRFVADASHELKTPLAVILANTQILEDDECINEDSKRWVKSTAEEAGRMRDLVNDLLTLARADESAAGVATGAMRHDDVNLSELVESSALEFDAVAFERGCLLETKVEEDVHVVGDVTWLERVVKILIDNACKYSSVGTTVTVKLVKTGSHAHLRVNNAGNTIDAEDLEHIFDRFYRSDKARSRDSDGAGGFGLGLAIAKGVVEAHGGKITATSDEQHGTTFEVLL